MSHGAEHAAGVCILKNRFNGKVLISDCDRAGHYIFLILEAALLSIFVALRPSSPLSLPLSLLPAGGDPGIGDRCAGDSAASHFPHIPLTIKALSM